MSWTCSLCGAVHAEVPLCFGADAPWRALVTEAEFEGRVELNDDVCVVDGRAFFIRGHVELPIVGTDETFVWSVWSSLSEASFRHVSERWDDEARTGDSYFGWLSTNLPSYAS